MSIRFLPSATDGQLATPAIDDADVNAWRVLPFAQTLNNTIASPAGWHSDELGFGGVVNDDYARNGHVLVTRTAAVPNRARPLWGCDFDAYSSSWSPSSPSAARSTRLTIGPGVGL